MDTTVALTNLDYALNYARECSWAIFPLHSITDDGFCTCGNASCKSEGKHPRTVTGCLEASKDEGQINAWWQQWPDANIGIATGQVSNLVVVDVDSDKGADHADLIIANIDQKIFNTPKVKTGAGMHYYYTCPVNADIRNSASKLGEFIDIRGEGGYVVAPPSKHISGKQYEFWGTVNATLQVFPDAWIDKLNAPATSQAAPASTHANGNGHIYVPPPGETLHVPETIKQGTRNHELTKVAGLLRRHGLSEGAILNALLVENQRICKPPLDDKEVHQISRSVGRYAPHEVLGALSDPDDTSPKDEDYENTLLPYFYGDFLEQQFEEKEILSFHIGKRDIAIIQAATNAGKTTLLRNIALCMAAGRPFMPFFEGSRPIRLAYFDFENDAQDVQRDLGLMDDVFVGTEMDLLKQNLIIIPKGLMNGELFQFNTHEKWANELIQGNGVEFIFVDNVSAAYDLNDENSNAEVTKKVIKPLLKMAYKGNCAFLFAHHYGKKTADSEHAGVHAGRGASALQALSKTVINLFGDVSKGEPVEVECAKRKSDGGQNYREVFRLDPDRWFHHTTIAPPPKKQSAYQAVRSYLQTFHYPGTSSMAEIIEKFENDFTEISIKKAVTELHKDGFIERPKHGQYCAKEQAGDTTKERNFYEKDED